MNTTHHPRYMRYGYEQLQNSSTPDLLLYFLGDEKGDRRRLIGLHEPQESELHHSAISILLISLPILLDIRIGGAWSST